MSRAFWWWVLLIYTGSRLLTTVILQWVVAAEQDPSIFTGDYPRYFDFAALWDGQWYQQIALHGYPSELPRDETGQVQQNAWAFYPVFPLAARGVMAITGLPFPIAATALATVCGYAAIFVVAGLLRQRVGSTAALAGVALVATYPASPTMQVAYTESLALLVLAGVLWAIDRQRWWLAAALALLTGVVRPVALPLGLVALVCILLRWRGRRERPLTRSEWSGMLGALIACGLSGLVWPAVAWISTAQVGAYPDTMSAWRGGADIVPFVPAVEISQWLGGDVRGPSVLLVLCLALVVAMLGPWARGLGPAMRTWCLGYVLYLVAALEPWTSIYRYLLLLFPLWVVLVGGGWAKPTQREPAWLVWVRTAVIAGLFLGWQVWWSWELFRFEPPSDNPP